MLTQVGFDRRCFRPNLVIGEVTALAERDWEGACLRSGQVLIGMESLRKRCIMTTFDPDTGMRDVGILLVIQKEFSGQLGLNGSVLESGRIAVGDAVELIPGV